MAKELVDYDFDCLLFCWSSAVCPFKIFLVLIVPPLWRDCQQYTSISDKLIEKSQTFQLAGSPDESGLKKRGLPKPRHISIFHFLTKIPPFCWSSFRYFQVSPQFGTERELILKANSFPMAPQRVHIPSRQTINKRTNERFWRTGLVHWRSSGCFTNNRLTNNSHWKKRWGKKSFDISPDL